jgi:hypothetical protein
MQDVYTIEERNAKDSKDKKSVWTKVGSAFPNKDGSLNVYLSALPINGKHQIRERKEKDE